MQHASTTERKLELLAQALASEWTGGVGEDPPGASAGRFAGFTLPLPSSDALEAVPSTEVLDAVLQALHPVEASKHPSEQPASSSPVRSPCSPSPIVPRKVKPVEGSAQQPSPPTTPKTMTQLNQELHLAQAHFLAIPREAKELRQKAKNDVAALETRQRGMSVELMERRASNASAGASAGQEVLKMMHLDEPLEAAR